MEIHRAHVLIGEYEFGGRSPQGLHRISILVGAPYVDVPMGARVETRPGQRTRHWHTISTGSPYSLARLTLTSLWEHVWGHVLDKEHDTGTRSPQDLHRRWRALR